MLILADNRRRNSRQRFKGEALVTARQPHAPRKDLSTALKYLVF
jgi:hypothetical protein